MQAKPLATNLGEQANKIAVSVQSGDGDVLALWGMCRRYAMQQATRWLRAFESSGGVELDDLEQSAFIGLLKAVQTWKPESGAFSTWYTIQLKAVFVEVYGMRTKRTREDPLNKYHLSLDTPLDENEDGSFTIADIYRMKEQRQNLRTSNNETFNRLCKRHLHNCQMHSARPSSVNSGSGESLMQRRGGKQYEPCGTRVSANR